MSLEISMPTSSAGSASTATESASKGFDPTELISIGVDITGGLLLASDNASAMKRMQRRIDKLTKEQETYLANKLKAVDDNTEKMRIVYEYLVIVENQTSLQALSDEKKRNLIILAAGIGVLAIIVIIGKYHG